MRTSWTHRLVAVALLALMGGYLVAEQPKVLRFDPKDYADTTTFKVDRAQYRHRDVTILIIQVRKVDFRSDPPPPLCRAWFEVRMQGKVLRQVYYDDVEALGGYYGIFVPAKQPLSEFFLATKRGDYDSRLLMVGADGSVADLPGGLYFATSDQRFLIGEQQKDQPAVIVVDVASRRVVIDGWKEHAGHALAHWYQDSEGYFFTEFVEGSDDDDMREDRSTAFRLDLVNHRVIRAPMSAKRIAGARRLRYTLESDRLEDCTYKPQ